MDKAWARTTTQPTGFIRGRKGAGFDLIGNHLGDTAWQARNSAPRRVATSRKRRPQQSASVRSANCRNAPVPRSGSKRRRSRGKRSDERTSYLTAVNVTFRLERLLPGPVDRVWSYLDTRTNFCGIVAHCCAVAELTCGSLWRSHRVFHARYFCGISVYSGESESCGGDVLSTMFRQALSLHRRPPPTDLHRLLQCYDLEPLSSSTREPEGRRVVTA